VLSVFRAFVIDYNLRFLSMPKKGDILELQIDRVAFGGQGIARLDGLVIFVKGAIPGDRVKALVFRKKKAYAEAKIQELLLPSTDRIEAPCPYFGICGGCQWQQVKYERQIEYKRAHVEEALSHIGSLPGIDVLDPIPSEKHFGYRNKMEFSFSDRPWLPYPPLEKVGRGSLRQPRLTSLQEDKESSRSWFDTSPRTANRTAAQANTVHPEVSKGEGWHDRGHRTGPEKDLQRDFALGLHVPGTFDKIIDVDACLLQQERGNEILREVKRFAVQSGLPPYGLKSHEGFWRFLTLRHSAYLDDWMVNLVTSELRTEGVLPLAQRLTTLFPNVTSVVNNITARKASIAVGEREVVLAGAGTIQDRIGSSTFQISANSFFQTNSLGAERLYGKVVEFAELTGRETVLDLYSGTGTIPIFLACSASKVIGMEIVESAVLDARRNCQANGIENCEFILGDIRDSLALLGIHPEVMVIDPPRAGMHQDVLSRVLEIGAERIVYVSCNPATLARDLALMQERYHIAEIQPVDMFPHTYHVECVAKLSKKKR
jgi:23S rRNA (uracil-5-)-methyltransferase RumA